MQTFLPYQEFEKSAKVLDRQRLGKQRVEVYQLLNAILRTNNGSSSFRGFRNHPCLLQWREYPATLAVYGMTICREWTRRGYQDTVRDKICDLVEEAGISLDPKLIKYWIPEWLGDPRIHSNHRARLLQKSPNWYGQYGWDEEPTTVNLWPITTIGTWVEKETVVVIPSKVKEVLK